LKYYAHSREGTETDQWQPLDEHLDAVSEIASRNAKIFSASQWASALGLYHDLGKGTLQWQAYLRNANGILDEFSEYYEGHPTHADVGAQWLFKNSKEAGKLLAYCIAGHHGGLPNWKESHAMAGLESRLKSSHPQIDKLVPVPEFPVNLPFNAERDRFGFQLQFFIRMIYSCLVDADYLDTENFLDKHKAEWRDGYPRINDISKKFWSSLNLLREKADSSTIVNQQRELVLKACFDKSGQRPGLFSLTVPTGGGKTLSSLAFALEHAAKYGKRRVIYVIPFTSIIEQNAKVFREFLGNNAVLEHHCNYVPDDSEWKTRLASENWDAPVVVTTNVQFFNSFYSNKPSKCRKLHNVADSIVIFDEVQAIPVEKLKPCIEVIKELSLNYGVTSVLCTATQPAIEYSEHFKSGLKDVCEIIEDVPVLFNSLRRTEERFIGELSENDVASRMSEYNQVLCIVNTRQQALDIFKAMPASDSNIHLSALMYPAHRTRELDKVRRFLDEGLPCRVVSTQLIEAGVDVDFPCVFRAAAGIDSIAQAAGRCNRNGKSENKQPVYIFKFPDDSATAFFRHSVQSAAKLFDKFDGSLTSPECVKRYFDDYFWKNEQRMDSDDTVAICIRSQSGNIQFKDIAEFKMIKSAAIPIIVAIEDSAQRLVMSMKYAESKGGIFRGLQKYTVQVFSHQFDEISQWLENPEPGMFLLMSKDLYSDKTGLKCKPPEGQAFFG